VAEKEQIARLLLAWYDQNARRLPWRGHPDPYAVWVSEIMLQQTRVETVIPYFLRWMERFPTIAALASAPEQEVLQVWEGLGYYSRARNLHHAAQQVVAQYGGSLPANRTALEKLPGIGKYTAGAVASMAFGLDEPALDGNIRRVLARLFNVSLPARSPEGEAELWRLARETLPAGHAGDYNQALMDLGSAICTPRNPTCLVCPLKDFCEAYSQGVQEERPILQARSPIPHITVTAAVIRRDGLVLLALRPSKGLLGGMWEFPGGKLEPGENLPDCLRREIREELGVEIEVGDPFGVYEHAYTHFRVTLHAFCCTLLDGEPRPLQAAGLRWVRVEEMSDFPMGKIDRQIARRLTDLL
jgi:A/G-specific adenine glycosylase